AKEYLVTVADTVINARGELVLIENRGGRKDKSAYGCGHRREVRIEERGLLGQSRGGNAIVAEGRANRAAAGRVRRRRQRVVDLVCDGAKITGEHARGGAGPADHVSLPLAQSLVVDEEKRLVLSVIKTRNKNRPTHRSSELV